MFFLRVGFCSSFAITCFLGNEMMNIQLFFSYACNALLNHPPAFFQPCLFQPCLPINPPHFSKISYMAKKTHSRESTSSNPNLIPHIHPTPIPLPQQPSPILLSLSRDHHANLLPLSPPLSLTSIISSSSSLAYFVGSVEAV